MIKLKPVWWVMLVLAAIVAVYFFALKKGRDEMRVSVANNAAIIKEIAELSALEVQGTATINVSNKADGRSIFGQLSNLLNESTMNLSIPYTAKYGIDMSDQNISINTKDSIVTIETPSPKLLSMQLQMDEIQGISKTGLFYQQSLDDYMKVHKKLYDETMKTLVDNANYKALASKHLQEILQRYYAPLGFKVQFTEDGKINSSLE